MQTREYLENYWLLFLDFLKLFGDLNYYGVPLPLLANFYQYLDGNVKKELNSPDFKQYLTQESLPEAQTQPEFERWLEKLKAPSTPKPLPGKILLYFDYLRFSPSSYHYFDPVETVILARWQKDNHHGIPVHNIKKYTPEKAQQDLTVLKSQTEKSFQTFASHFVFGTQFFYDTFMTRLPLMIEGLAAINRYFDQHAVRCVIVGTTEDLFARILTLVAANRGIPSICLQHGVLGGDEAYIPAFASLVGVFGNYERDWYVRMGMPEDRIAITGHPRFDDIFTQPHMSRTEFHQKFDLDPGKTTIFLATQPNFPSLWDGLLKILAEKSHLQIVIKPHPLESTKSKNQEFIKVYEKYAARYPSVKLIPQRDLNINDFLANADVVVTNLSTASIEAMLFDKPLLLLTDVYFAFFDNLSEYVFSDPAQLAAQIDSEAKVKELQRKSIKAREAFMQYAYPKKLSGPVFLELVKNLTGNQSPY